MNIRPYDKTIKDLLKSGRQFLVPRFQREYSWEKRHYQEFLEDLLKGITIDEKGTHNSTYFLGTMLFVGNFIEKGDKAIQIVDGQQRITTITILFSVISDIFRELKQDELSKLIFEYIMTKDDDGKPVRIIKSETSYPYFSYFIQDRDKANITDPSSEEEECIRETYEFFKTYLAEKNMRKFFKTRYGDEVVDNIQYVDFLKAIREQVLSCVFVSISTDDESQANRIFEILNAKGKRLSYIDLIKNKIFEELPETEPADFAKCKWEEIKKSINECDIESVGFGTYFRHYWASKYGITQASKLYDAFIKKVKPAEYKQLLLDLVENASYYIRTLKPKKEDYANRKEYFWLVQSLDVFSNYFNVAQVRVVLMPLMSAKEHGMISMKNLKTVVLFLENFHFAYTAILSGKANKLDGIYSHFAVDFRKCTSNEECARVLNEELYMPLKGLIPTCDQFVDKFRQLSYSKSYLPSNMKCKYALYKLNAYYQGSELFENDSSIEHIFPEDTDDERVLNIGNLMALETKINNDAANKQYKEKIELYKKSSYFWVQDFVEHHETWKLDDIEERAKELGRMYYEKILGFDAK